MIPVGYMYKTISDKPDWLRTEQVTDIYSVSSCISEDFDGWVNYWKHNGYWFFDSPEIIENLSKIHGITLDGMRLFFYLAYEKQWDDDDHAWKTYQPEKSFSTDVMLPKKRCLMDSILFHSLAKQAQNARHYPAITWHRNWL